MTMDVSRLGVIVESSGIKEASSALSGLGRAADNAETKVNRLTDAVERLLKQNVSATMQAWAASMQAMSNAMNTVGAGASGYAMALTNGSTAAQKLSGVTNILNQQFNQQGQIIGQTINNINNYAASTGRAAAASEGWASRTGVMLNTLKAMTTAFLYYETINLAKGVVENADKWTNLRLKLVAATGSQNNANVAMEQSYEIAQKMATPLEGTIKLYTRLAPALAQAGFDSSKTKEIVTGLASAFHLGGATTGEMNQAILNFSHSMSGGHLTLRAFNSLTAEAPLVLRAVADQMTGGNMDALRKLVSAHKVGAKEIVSALQTVQPAWNKLIEERPVTVEMAITRLKNTWLKAVGEMGQDTGFNTELAKGVTMLQGMIPSIVRGLGEAFIAIMKWIDQNKEGLMEIGGQIKGLIVDVIKVGEGFFGWVGGITGASGALGGISYIIFTIRFTIALIQDAFKFLTAGAAEWGATLADFVLTPVKWLLEMISWLQEKAAGFLNTLAAGASAIGKGELAQQFTDMAKSMTDASGKVDSYAQKISHLTDGAHAFAKATIDDPLSHVNALIDSASDVGDAWVKAYKAKGKYDEHFNKNPQTEEDAKTAAAIAKETNKQAEAMAALNTEYDKLMARQEAMSQSAHPLKVGPNEAEYLRIQNEILAVNEKVGLLNRSQVIEDLNKQLVLAQVNAVVEQGLEFAKQQDEAANKQLTSAVQVTKAIQDQVKALQERNAAYDHPGGKAGLTNESADEIQRQINTAQTGLDNPVPGASNDDIERQKELIVTLTDRLVATQALSVEQEKLAQHKLTESWDKLMDDKKATKFTDALTKGFGNVGKAVGMAANALRTMSENQDKVNRAQQIAKDTAEGPLKIQREAEAANLAMQLQMDNYANLAQAAQGFFDKGTVGYKVMGAAEKSFRLLEMAMAIETFIRKTGLVAAFTAVHTAGAATEVATTEASVAPTLAAEAVKATAKGITALAGTLASLPFPYNVAAFAAVAALLVGVGVAVTGAGGGGGGSDHLAANRQATQGTGTVLGDSTKQSESIANSLKALQSNSNIALKYSSAMVISLQSIESALTGTTNSIVMNGSGITGKGYQNVTTGTMKDDFKTAFTGGLTAFMTGNFSTALTEVLGIKSSKTLTDSGILAASQTIGSILSNGFKASQYQDTKSSHSIFGISLGSSTNQSTQALDPAITNNFTQIIRGMTTTVTQAAEALGMNGTTVAAQLDKITVSLGNISLKGLTAEQITAQLSAVFSAFGDSITTTVLGPAIAKFQQSGEGLLQTAVRVASGVEEAGAELSKLGLTAINFNDIVNTSSNVGEEIVRQTILLKEAGTGVGAIISTMSADAETLGDTYKSLLAARRSLQGLAIAKDVTADLIAAAGGLEALQSSLNSYTKNFFTAAEQQTMAVSTLRQEFAGLGLSLPTTKDAFRSLVTQLSAGDAASQALAVKVLGLSDAFSDAYSVVSEAVSNATTDLTDAYNKQADAINTAKTAFTGFATTLKQFKTSLMTGDLSVDNAVQKYQTEKTLYEQTQAAAMAGDQTAISNFQDVAQAFLEASRAVYASGGQYTADYQTVLQQTDALQQYSAGQATLADQQLTALNQQVSGLITVNASVLTVAQAIKNLQDLMAQGLGLGSAASGGFSFNGSPVDTVSNAVTQPTSTVMPVVNGSHEGGLPMVPFDGYIARLHKDEGVLTAQENKAYQSGGSAGASQDVVNELRALREEVTALRSGQRDQTGALIAATYDSNEQNAQAVVDGVKEANKDSSYNQRAKVTLS